MKHFFLLLLLFAGIGVTGKAQTAFTFEEGAPIPLDSSETDEIVAGYKGGCIVHKEIQHRHFLVQYDSLLHETARTEIGMTRTFPYGEEKKNFRTSLHTYCQLGEFLVLFYKLEPDIAYFVVRYNLSDLKALEGYDEVMPGEIRTSSDHDNLLIYHGFLSADNKDAYSLKVYGKDFMLSWEKDFQASHDFSFFSDFTISNTGNVAFLSFNKTVKHPLCCIDWIHNGGTDFDYYVFQPTGELLQKIISFLPDGRPFVAGYYGEYLSGVLGTFFAIAFDNEKAISSFQKFPPDLWKTCLPASDTARYNKKMPRQVSFGIVLHQLIRLDNGNIVLVGQEEPLPGLTPYNFGLMNQDGSPAEKKSKVNGYLLLSCMDSLGEMNWNTWIFKGQVTTDTRGTYTAFVTNAGNNLLCFFNDNPHNYEKAQSTLRNGVCLCGNEDSSCMATVVEINNEGQQKRTRLETTENGSLGVEKPYCKENYFIAKMYSDQAFRLTRIIP